MPRTQPTPRRRRRPPPTPRAPPSPTNRLPGQGAVQLKYRRLDLHTYEILYRTEETHWWLAARRNIVLDWIRQRYPGRDDLDILDAGCGTGLMLQELKLLGNAEGFDFNEAAPTDIYTLSLHDSPAALAEPVRGLPQGGGH